MHPTVVQIKFKKKCNDNNNSLRFTSRFELIEMNTNYTEEEFKKKMNCLVVLKLRAVDSADKNYKNK